MSAAAKETDSEHSQNNDNASGDAGSVDPASSDQHGDQSVSGKETEHGNSHDENHTEHGEDAGDAHGKHGSKHSKTKRPPLKQWLKEKMVIIGGITNIIILLGILGILVKTHLIKKSLVSVSDMQFKPEKVEESKEGEGHGGGHGSESKEGKEEEGKHGEAKPSDALPGLYDPADGKYAKMYSVDQMLINLYHEENEPVKYARISFAFNVRNRTLEKELKSKIHMVRDVIIEVVNSKSEAEMKDPKKRLFVTKEIEKSVNKFLTEGQVDGVYISQILLDPHG